MPPKVSIIMPAYNSAETISEAVLSILSQTFTHWELLIINDGSSDNTLEIANGFTDERISVLSHDNCGVAKTRNCGIKAATGELIAFLDADDLWLPEKLQAQVTCFAAGNENLGLVHHNYIEFGDFGERLPGCLKHCKGLALAGNVWQDLMIVNFIGTLSVMATKTAIEQAGGFDESLNGPEDWDLWLKIAKDNEIEYFPQPMALYRQHEGGISKDYRPYAAQLYRVLERHLLQFGDKPSQARGLWLHNRHMAHGFARAGQKKQAIKHLKEACKAKPLALANLISAVYIAMKRK